jgi:hypothetical protein
MLGIDREGHFRPPLQSEVTPMQGLVAIPPGWQHVRASNRFKSRSAEYWEMREYDAVHTPGTSSRTE